MGKKLTAVIAGPGEGGSRYPLLKVHAIRYDGAAVSNVLTDEQKKTVEAFGQVGALTPPYAPDNLCSLLENSNALRQNIDSYATNIDGYGHRFVPAIDLNDSEADNKIADALFIEKVYDARKIQGAVDPSTIPQPTAEEIKKRKDAMVLEMRVERVMLENFFDFASIDQSFVGLRMRTRLDKELMGYAFWEVVRNDLNEIVELKYVPAYTMRLLPAGDWVDAVVKTRVSAVRYDEQPRRRRFRRYVQIDGAKTVWFKEFGDRRVMSAKTGRYYDTLEILQASEAVKNRNQTPAQVAANKPIPATEVMEFKVHTPRGAYGVPRWIGNLLAVLGSRSAEEVNYFYFDNKAIPSMIVAAEGGTLTSESIDELKRVFAEDLRGKQNFHQCLVIQGIPFENQSGDKADSSKMRIRFQPLQNQQISDALFQEYDKRNRDKVGEAFRLPRLLRGDVQDVNRATADASLLFAEAQVFSPERKEFDHMINRTLMADLGAKYHTFESRGPEIKDPSALSAALAQLGPKWLTGSEVRQFAGDVLGHELKDIDEPWTKQPFEVQAVAAQAEADVQVAGAGEGGVVETEAQVPQAGDKVIPIGRPKGKVAPASTDDADTKEEGRRTPKAAAALTAIAKLLAVRDALTEAEGESSAPLGYRVAKNEDGDTVIEVPAEIMRRWFTHEGG